MALTALTVGPVIALTQNTSYAVPGINKVGIRSTDALETSLDENTWVAFPLTNGEAECSAPFIRCTSTTTCKVRLVRIG